MTSMEKAPAIHEVQGRQFPSDVGRGVPVALGILVSGGQIWCRRCAHVGATRNIRRTPSGQTPPNISRPIPAGLSTVRRSFSPMRIQPTPDALVELTASWDGERFPDGRP